MLIFKPALFDDLVGAGEDGRRDRQAERLGSLEVDHQLEGRGLLHRQVAGQGPSQYPVYVEYTLSPPASANSGQG